MGRNRTVQAFVTSRFSSWTTRKNSTIKFTYIQCTLQIHMHTCTYIMYFMYKLYTLKGDNRSSISFVVSVSLPFSTSLSLFLPSSLPPFLPPFLPPTLSPSFSSSCHRLLQYIFSHFFYFYIFMCVRTSISCKISLKQLSFLTTVYFSC